MDPFELLFTILVIGSLVVAGIEYAKPKPAAGETRPESAAPRKPRSSRKLAWAAILVVVGLFGLFVLMYGDAVARAGR